MASKKNLLMIIGLFVMVILISSEVAARNLAKTSSTSREAEIVNEQNGEGSVKHDNSTRLGRDDGHSSNYTVNTFDDGSEGGGELPGGGIPSGGMPGGGGIPGMGLPGRGLPPGSAGSIPVPSAGGGTPPCDDIFGLFGCPGGNWWPWTPSGGIPSEGGGGTPPGGGGGNWWPWTPSGGIPSEGGGGTPLGGGGYDGSGGDMPGGGGIPSQGGGVPPGGDGSGYVGAHV